MNDNNVIISADDIPENIVDSAHELGARKNNLYEVIFACIVCILRTLCSDLIAYSNIEANKVSNTDSVYRPDFILINPIKHFFKYIELDGTFHFMMDIEVSTAIAHHDKKRVDDYRGDKQVIHVVLPTCDEKTIERGKVYLVKVAEKLKKVKSIICPSNISNFVSPFVGSVAKARYVEQSRTIFNTFSNLLKEASGIQLEFTDEAMLKIISSYALSRYPELLMASYSYLKGNKVSYKNKGLLQIIVEDKFKDVPKTTTYLKKVVARDRKSEDMITKIAAKKAVASSRKLVH